MAAANFEQDEILGKAYDARLMRRLAVFVGPYWRQLSVALALLLGAALAELAPPYLVRTAIDGPIAAHDPAGILPIFALYVGALLAAFACRYGQTYIMQSTGQQVMVDIRMLILSWRLALISFIMLPAMVVATMFFQRVMRSAFRAVRQRLALINAYLNEQITGVLVTQLFNREERSRIRFDELSADYRAAQFRSLTAFAIFFPVVSFLSVTATALLLNLGGQVVLGGLATIGMLVAFIQYTDQAFGPIRQIAENYNTLQSAMASSERIFRILDAEAEVRDPQPPRALAQPVRGAIEFKDVWFSYSGGVGDQGSGIREPVQSDQPGSRSLAPDPRSPDWVLRGITLTIPAGQSVAVVGATGAGKTSLIS